MNRVAANLPARLSSSSEEITMEPDGLQTFIDDVGLVVSSTDDEHEITKRVAERLSDLLAGGYRLPPSSHRPNRRPSAAPAVSTGSSADFAICPERGLLHT
jgi:hypothetical protein